MTVAAATASAWAGIVGSKAWSGMTPSVSLLTPLFGLGWAWVLPYGGRAASLLPQADVEWTERARQKQGRLRLRPLRSSEPWEIWEDYKTRRSNNLRLHKDLYFFTQHKKMKSTDKRIRHTVASGTWKGNDSEMTVKSFETGHVIGSNKRFTYENEKSEHHGCWILHEFYLDQLLRDKKEKVKD
ncbi:hypothetical protein ACLB2K_072808 [Fragaria x ananassa]